MAQLLMVALADVSAPAIVGARQDISPSFIMTPLPHIYARIRYRRLQGHRNPI
jgi:hypothetical protein